MRREKEDVFAIKGPGGKNLLVTKIPIPTLDSVRQTVNPIQKLSSTNKPKQSLENSVSPKQSKLNKKLSNKSATTKSVNENIQESFKYIPDVNQDPKSFTKTTKTADNIRIAIGKPNQTINALSSKKTSIKRCLDQTSGFEQNPKYPKILHLDSLVSHIRKFHCKKCSFKTSSQSKFDRHNNSRHITHIDTIGNSNRPLIRKEGELTGLFLTVKKEIMTNPHKVGFDEDNVIVIDY